MEKEKITPTFYDEFKKYNAEAEGDIDIIQPKLGSKRPPLKYLKWMRGWQEVMKVDPTATYEPVMNNNGEIVHHVGNGGMVCIRVTIQGETKDEWYPVESSPMCSVKFEDITPTQVNKSIKRGMVKCLAQFGLAANLYLNDELTEDEKDIISSDITSLINSATTRDDLTQAYMANKEIIDKTPRLLRQFQAKGKELQLATINK